MDDPHQIISSPYVQILLVLGLSFLMGLEREEHKLQPGAYIAAGVRTFPLIALLGYALAILAPDSFIPVATGLLAVSLFLLLAYWHKLTEGNRGFTSEMAALVAYAMGALIAHNQYWIAVAIAVADVLLLSGKRSLRGLAQRLDEGELITFVKFLLLTAVILPIVPNRAYTVFAINPFRTWLIVVVVCGVSYGSYLLQRRFRERDSAILSGLLGGAYSSTLATVSLAKHSRGQEQPRLYAGAIVLATAVMYVRLGVLIFIFNAALGMQLAVVLAGLAGLTAVVGLAMTISPRAERPARLPAQAIERNPLELTTAFVFAALFIVLTVATRLVATHLGSAGVYALAVVMGVSDIDPFVMGLAQSGGQATGLAVAAFAVLLATASNNVAKGVYALVWGGRRVGSAALAALAMVSAVGVIAYALVAHALP